ncbi:reverse transcriptase domain-containing protein [Tanacetum coccineum]|uniref:Reverse transcriptase domain-containing protein n=1 Tax=Tanacetum coccineum TaxID=301880 RepID=A0ABQ4WQ90_9ASTR
MFNSTLTGSARVWFDDLPPESVDSYDDLKEAFLANFRQQRSASKTLWRSIISSREKESLRKIFFASNDDSGRKRNSNKFFEFHGEVGHNTDECMHLKRQIEELLKNGKLSHVIKELKQSSRKDQPKANKKGETSNKDKALAILMVQPWQRVARQRITQSFSPNPKISFPPLEEEEEEGTKGPMIIEKEIGGHFIHRMYVDGGSASEILYEHCFNRLRPEIRNHLVPATASLIGFSGEIISLLGQLSLLEKIGDAEHSTSQKRRSQAADRNQAIQEEVEKLVDAGIMKEVHYHSWLSNPVMVKKHDDSWRMCVDFKDLNKACPKDGYPLSEIDWKLESLCGFPFKCFLDAYKGYHQIKMANEDEEKTTFITSQGVFCYSKMPFGLRNVRATYQRLADKAFHKQISRNLEVYVDDLVIKSRTEDEIIRDIEETFKTQKEINMKLNLKECTFGVEEGMFLGYKVNTNGIKVCPDKVDAVLSLPSPKCLKDILASLNKFLAKSAEKSLPFFKTLKKCTKKSDFHWTEEAEAVFKQMKQLIAELPTLTTPEEKEDSLSTGRQQKKPPRVSVKGQILADFIVERPEEDDLDTAMDVEEELPKSWTLFTDGSSCADGSRAGLILTSPEGAEFTYALRFRFEATNNEAEYEALLRIAEEMGVKNLQENVDSSSRRRGEHLDDHDLEYHIEETLPAEVNKARAVRRKLQRFAVINVLYKKSFLGPWIRPTMHKDARALIRACQDCQVHKPIPRNPQQKLTPITSPWPFYKWGIDIAGPFPEGPGKVKFLIVAIDYFTKWIEAKPVATITGSQVKKFVWDNIVCKFGLPGEIISNNGKQFRDNPVKDFCEKLWEGIKARLDARSKNWMEEISHVLWAHRTMIKSSNMDTPFSLTYGTEAVILVEIGMPTLRTTEVDMVQNNEALGMNLDLLDGRRE